MKDTVSLGRMIFTLVDWPGSVLAVSHQGCHIFRLSFRQKENERLKNREFFLFNYSFALGCFHAILCCVFSMWQI